MTHPFVIGELALGNLRQRGLILDALRDLPRATLAADREVTSSIGKACSEKASAMSMRIFSPPSG
jgi:hypothetical protein